MLKTLKSFIMIAIISFWEFIGPVLVFLGSLIAAIVIVVIAYSLAISIVYLIEEAISWIKGRIRRSYVITR